MKTYGSFGAAWGLGLAVLLTAGCAQGQMNHGGMPMDQNSMQQMMSDWHPAAQKAAMHMMNKYGPPAEMTPTMAIWGETGPWKRSIVYAEAVQHDFPLPHPDVFEQFIDYEMPEQMFDEIAMYDGSVIVERTKGEMSARCDKEGANFLAVNLANEIATGQSTVEEARQMYGEQIKMMMDGQMTAYTSGLMFTPPPSGNDPGERIIWPN